MKKRISILMLLVATIIFTAVGCSAPKTEEVTPPAQEEVEPELETDESEEMPEEAGLTIEDHLGRTVTLDQVPEKIVSGYYISTSAVIALGLEDKLVGVEAKADSRPIYSLAAPQLLDLPNVGTAKEFDLEGCIALEPDLVILPIRLKDQIQTLEDMGIAAIGVNPEDQELLEEMLTIIATLNGIDVDKELIEYYNTKEAEFKNIHVNQTEKPKVYLAGNSNLLSTAAAKMYQNDLIEIAGGTNVAGDIDDSYWAEISYEQLVQYNPEYIIIVPEAKYSKEDVMNDANLVGIDAIENNKVYEMPSQFEAWDSPVPSATLGKAWLTSILYPEDYTNEEFANEVNDFYGKFYGFTIEKEELSAQ